MRVAFRCPRVGARPALLAVFAVAACHRTNPFEVEGSPSRTFSITVGEELTIDIGGAGPGFAVPPTLIGSTVEFLNETSPPSKIVSPGGELEQYHFKGLSAGRTIIMFVNPVLPTIADTVTVQAPFQFPGSERL